MTTNTSAPLDPRRTESVGAELARRLPAIDNAVVVCWDVSDDAVLAHVVARELGVPLLRAGAIEGIVELEDALPAGATAVLVAEEFTGRTALAGLAGVVAHGGGRVAAVATARPGEPVTGTEAENATVIVAGAGT